jgi:hypothetical protein
MSGVVAECRRLCPARTLAPWEARSIAERQAHRFHALLGISEPPFPKEAIETLPRLEIRYFNSLNLSGSVSWQCGKWRMLINASESRGRQAFSRAHELKHVLDHPMVDRLYRDSRLGSADALSERAADQFAAALLMPRAWLKRCFYDEGFRDFRVLARRFGVSVPAMRWRFDELGLLEPEVVR